MQLHSTLCCYAWNTSFLKTFACKTTIWKYGTHHLCLCFFWSFDLYIVLLCVQFFHLVVICRRRRRRRRYFHVVLASTRAFHAMLSSYSFASRSEFSGSESSNSEFWSHLVPRLRQCRRSMRIQSGSPSTISTTVLSSTFLGGTVLVEPLVL